MKKLNRKDIAMLIMWCKYTPENDHGEYTDYDRAYALHSIGMSVYFDVLGLLRYFKIIRKEYIGELIDKFNNVFFQDEELIEYLHQNNYTLAKLADIIEIKMKETSEDIITLTL